MEGMLNTEGPLHEGKISVELGHRLILGGSGELPRIVKVLVRSMGV